MYTPQTVHIKQAYVFDQVREAETLKTYDENTVKEAGEQFDRWLQKILGNAKGLTPALEEVRRHWGLAVDTHRREERLAQFDRMIKSHVESAIHKSLTQVVATIENEEGSVYILSDDVSKLMKGVLDNV